MTEEYIRQIVIDLFNTQHIINLAYKKGVAIMSIEHIQEIISDVRKRIERVNQPAFWRREERLAEIRRELRLAQNELKLLNEMIAETKEAK